MRYIWLMMIIPIWAVAEIKYNVNVFVMPQYKAEGMGNFENAVDSATSEMEIRTARVKLKVKPNDKTPLGAVVSFNFARTEILRNAYLYLPLDDFKLFFGQYRVPFGLDYQRRLSDLSLHGRAESSDELKEIMGGALRQVGLGTEYKSSWGQTINVHLFESANVYDFPGLVPLQTLSFKSVQEIGDFDLGLSWMSESFKLRPDEFYRAHFFSGYLTYVSKDWRFEWESIQYDDQVALYQTSLGTVQDQLEYSHLGTLEYKWHVLENKVLAPMLQVEHRVIPSGNEEKLRQGMSWYIDSGKKPANFGISLNSSMIYQQRNNRWIWDSMSLRLLYRLGWKGKV